MSGPDRFERHFQRKRDEKDRHAKSLPGEDEAPLPPPVESIRKDKPEPGRNDPCPCGSGRKYKQCCWKKK